MCPQLLKFTVAPRALGASPVVMSINVTAGNPWPAAVPQIKLPDPTYVTLDDDGSSNPPGGAGEAGLRPAGAELDAEMVPIDLARNMKLVGDVALTCSTAFDKGGGGAEAARKALAECRNALTGAPAAREPPEVHLRTLEALARRDAATSANVACRRALALWHAIDRQHALQSTKQAPPPRMALSRMTSSKGRAAPAGGN